VESRVEQNDTKLHCCATSTRDADGLPKPRRGRSTCVTRRESHCIIILSDNLVGIDFDEIAENARKVMPAKWPFLRKSKQLILKEGKETKIDLHVSSWTSNEALICRIPYSTSF
jgi:hypothetical protein